MYEIIWTHRAFRAMQRLIAAHLNRKADFSAALRRMTDELSRDPFAAGESRLSSLRVCFPGVLTVYYAVDTFARTVRLIVIGMRKAKPKP